MPSPANALYECGPGASVRAPVLVHCLTGAMDAGHAGRLAIRQIISSMPRRRVATFSPDAFVDYRSNRPVIEMTDWVVKQTYEPYIALDVVEDYRGRSLFVLHGAEPDLRWQEFAAVVGELMRERGVERTASFVGLPATMPHTRPTFVSRIATTPELVPAQQAQPTPVTMGASMDLYLQTYLGRVGFEAHSLVVGVPHYLVHSEYPAASVVLLSHLADMWDLSLPIGDLEADAETSRKMIDAMVADAGEVNEVIRELEREYDADKVHIPRRVRGNGDLDLPSGDALARTFEDFLQHNDLQRSKRFEHRRARREAERTGWAGRDQVASPPRGRGRHRRETTED